MWPAVMTSPLVLFALDTLIVIVFALREVWVRLSFSHLLGVVFPVLIRMPKMNCSELSRLVILGDRKSRRFAFCWAVVILLC